MGPSAVVAHRPQGCVCCGFIFAHRTADHGKS